MNCITTLQESYTTVLTYIGFNASANYSKRIKGFRSAVEFDGVNRFLTVSLLGGLMLKFIIQELYINIWI